MTVTAERHHDRTESLLHEIREVIGETDEGVPIHLVRRSEPEGDAIYIEKITRFAGAIERLAPARTIYRKMADELLLHHRAPDNSRETSERLKAVLIALKDDLAEHRLRTVEEVIHGDLLTDMLDMSVRLLSDGFKDSAAVLAGSVLTEHLRRLCIKHGVVLTMVMEKDLVPKTVARMNEDLPAVDAYSQIEKRNVNAWNLIRVKAYIQEFESYTDQQVQNFVSGLREFITRHPA